MSLTSVRRRWKRNHPAASRETDTEEEATFYCCPGHRTPIEKHRLRSDQHRSSKTCLPRRIHHFAAAGASWQSSTTLSQCFRHEGTSLMAGGTFVLFNFLAFFLLSGFPVLSAEYNSINLCVKLYLFFIVTRHELFTHTNLVCYTLIWNPCHARTQSLFTFSVYHAHLNPLFVTRKSLSPDAVSLGFWQENSLVRRFLLTES